MTACIGIATALPVRAAACSERQRFNDFEAWAAGNGVWLEYLRRGLITPKIFLWPSGTVVFTIVYVGQLVRGKSYPVRMRFNDGTRSTLLMFANEGDTIDGRQTSVLSEAVKDTKLLQKFRARSWVVIEIDGIDAQPVVPNNTSDRISLKGTNAAADWALRQLPSCDGRSEGIGAVRSCFLTTACVEMLGLDDDCFELRTLRKYRDVVMSKTQRGRLLIDAYLTIGPRILGALDQMPARERSRILRTIYGRYILPSAVLAWLGFDRGAERLYITMMRKLSANYAPEFLRSDKYFSK
ncbi:MAG: hypothetical protein AAGI03_08370 [Pseudomonadota bacterium]